ncbi:hypothetical protein [Inquilinus sp. CA228]|uniref:hypothetical protein n=1 Tax=Inquilinus sp. CA228 TaxID=3455609 RepID=UPI003F8D5CD2
MRYAAVTTYARKHWRSHAQRMVESFETFWSGVPLMHLDDDELDLAAPGLARFKQLHRQARHRGQLAGGYDMRFDAVRFAHKVYAIGSIDTWCRRVEADVLVWLDADTVTHAPVDAAWLDGLIGEADVACLLRDSKYTECGFVMIRLNEAGHELIRRWVGLYESGALFRLAEWHDSFAFDHVRLAMQEEGRLAVASLSGDAAHRNHPFVAGPLGERLDHLKGPRKAAGRSRPGDLIAPRSEPYWSGRHS